MKKSPKQIVEKDLGGRDKLIDEIIPLLETKDPAIKARLRGVSNAKLMKLRQAGLEVRKQFQSKANLVKQIAEKQFAPGKPDPAFAEKISEYSVKRLLDMYRQVAGRA